MSTTTAESTRTTRRGYPAENKGPKNTVGDKAFATVAHILLIIWSIIVILPMLWMVMSSFKTSSEIFQSPFSLPANWSFENYESAWDRTDIGSAFINTIGVVGLALFLVMLLGSMCSYVLARFRFRGSQLIYWAMLAGLTFPVILAVVPLNLIMQRTGIIGANSIIPAPYGLVVAYVAFALPFTVFFLYAFFKQLPFELSEAAQLDGAGNWRTFFQVMLPMARPGLASIAIFNFLGLWNQYLLAVTLNPAAPENRVLAQALGAFLGTAGYNINYGALFAALVITVVPILIVYIIFQRQLQGSVSQGTSR